MAQTRIPIEIHCRQLLERVKSLKSVVVAFSGGVDSAVVACAAQRALGDRAIAITSRSASLPAGELELARTLAAEIGIKHEIIDTQELQQPDYVANTGNRCYWCKKELYREIELIRSQTGRRFIVNGTNRDDLSDYRPGLQAARERDVLSPLVDCNIGKRAVREMARSWGLSVWNKPAGPCLASRIAPGVTVTVGRLKMVDAAESILREMGLQPVRVRLHENDMARIEVASNQVESLLDFDVRSHVARQLKAIGFRYITIDLEGFRSGSFNQLVTLPAKLK